MALLQGGVLPVSAVEALVVHQDAVLHSDEAMPGLAAGAVQLKVDSAAACLLIPDPLVQQARQRSAPALGRSRCSSPTSGRRSRITQEYRQVPSYHCSSYCRLRSSNPTRQPEAMKRLSRQEQDFTLTRGYSRQQGILTSQQGVLLSQQGILPSQQGILPDRFSGHRA